MDIRPYISIDLETTGLNTHHSHILEIAAILDDGVKPIDELDRFHAILKWERFDWAEPYAMNMNAGLLKIIAEGKDEALMEPIQALARFCEFVVMNSRLAKEYDERQGWKRPSNKVYLAGKNAGGFDIPILKSNFELLGNSNISWKVVEPFIHYKVLDVGSMYYNGAIPSLGEINKITGRSENVSHRAMDDALDVVYAVRKFAGKL